MEQLCHFLVSNAIYTKGEWYLPKEFKNVIISRLISVHPVTLSRMLTALTDAGYLNKTENGLLLLNKNGLQEIANGQTVFPYRKAISSSD